MSTYSIVSEDDTRLSSLVRAIAYKTALEEMRRQLDANRWIFCEAEAIGWGYCEAVKELETAYNEEIKKAGELMNVWVEVEAIEAEEELRFIRPALERIDKEIEMLQSEAEKSSTAKLRLMGMKLARECLKKMEHENLLAVDRRDNWERGWF